MFVTGGDNTKIHVIDCGNRSRQPIVFIHGISQSSLCWEKQFHSLSKEFRLVALDLRGHGKSEKPRCGYDNTSNWAEDIHSVITELRLETPVLVAWSYGGLVACDYLRLYGDAAISGINFVSAETTLGTKWEDMYSTPQRNVINDGFICESAEANIDAVQKFVRLSFFHRLSVGEFYFIYGYNMVVPPYVRKAMLSRVVANWDILPRISRPVLVTHGLRDNVIHPLQSEIIASTIQGAQLSLYEDTGHTPFWENPSRFNGELRDFVYAICG